MGTQIQAFCNWRTFFFPELAFCDGWSNKLSGVTLQPIPFTSGVFVLSTFLHRCTCTKQFVWHVLLLAGCLLSCWKSLSGTQPVESITLQGRVLQRLQPVVGNTHFLLPGFSSCLKINNDNKYLRITQLGSTLGFSQIGTARFLTTKDLATVLKDLF